MGQVGRAHGIRGEVSVDPRTDEPAERFAVGSVLRPDPSGRDWLTVRTCRPHGARLLVAFEEVAGRTQAEGLRGATLLADVEPDATPAEPDEFYDHQLVGLVVRTENGREVGSVRAVRHVPGQDLLVVATDGGATHLVPFVRELVPQVDLAAGLIVVDVRPGLLHTDDADVVDDAVVTDGSEP